MDIKLFTPYEKQKEVLDGFLYNEKLFGVVVAPRGSGKTLLGINMLLYWALEKPNRKTAWIAPIYNQSKSVYDQIILAARDIIIQNNRQDLLLTFVNGSTIKFLSTDNADTIRGFRFSHVVVDEIAFQKERSIDQVVLPTLNPNGKKCLMISTPRGKNFFYNWFMRGQEDNDDVVSFRIKLTECPYVQPSLIEAARQSLPPDLYKQEFEAQFVDSSNDVFIGIEKVSTVTEYDHPRGQDAYVGIDTGLTSDMSVLSIVSPTGKVLWFESINNMNINSIAETFKQRMLRYNIVGGYIETNGIGRAMFDLVAPSFRKIKPFTTTQDSKTEMVRKLISDIETMTIELPTDQLEPVLHREFATYTYKLSQNGKLTFTHSPGQKDDHIDALLMANYSRVQFMERRPMSIGTSTINTKPRFGNMPR